MKFIIGLLLVGAVFAVEEDNEQTARDKRQLFLVPQPVTTFGFDTRNRIPQTVFVPSQSPPQKQVFIKEYVQCGQPHIRCEGACASRQQGGIPVVQAEFPWTTLIKSQDQLLCGGSLIDNQYILTTAGCITPTTPNSVAALRVFLGEHMTGTNQDGPVEERNVSVVFRHRDYVPAQRGSAPKFDIALLKLDRPVQFNKKIQPICVDDGKYNWETNQFEGVIAGWGKLSYSNRPVKQTLHKTNVGIYAPMECQNNWAANGISISTDQQVCAGLQNREACSGDNGQALVVKTGSNNWLQLGILSYGLTCSDGPATIYTRASAFRDWIEKVRMSDAEERVVYI